MHTVSTLLASSLPVASLYRGGNGCNLTRIIHKLPTGTMMMKIGALAVLCLELFHGVLDTQLVCCHVYSLENMERVPW